MAVATGPGGGGGSSTVETDIIWQLKYSSSDDGGVSQASYSGQGATKSGGEINTAVEAGPAIGFYDPVLASLLTLEPFA